MTESDAPVIASLKNQAWLWVSDKLLAGVILALFGQLAGCLGIGAAWLFAKNTPHVVYSVGRVLPCFSEETGSPNDRTFVFVVRLKNDGRQQATGIHCEIDVGDGQIFEVSSQPFFGVTFDYEYSTKSKSASRKRLRIGSIAPNGLLEIAITFSAKSANQPQVRIFSENGSPELLEITSSRQDTYWNGFISGAIVVSIVLTVVALVVTSILRLSRREFESQGYPLALGDPFTKRLRHIATPRLTDETTTDSS